MVSRNDYSALSAAAQDQPEPAPEPAGTTLAQLALVGDSPQFRDALNLIRKVAACNATVLINGETGTGKELAARAIHYLGGRRNAPFIAVNCGAIADTLIESEFFGHVRGAFTDARESRAGLIAQARGGTLYLDELEALSPRGQATLLRFLQDQEYRPVGGVLVRNADVRVIASSNVDLMAAASGGTFRSDLLFRLSVLTVCLPPLRDRPGDARLLADCFIRRLSAQYGKPSKPLDAAALEFLDRYHWPGNIRELENLVHREFVLGEGPCISLSSGSTPNDKTSRLVRSAPKIPIDCPFRQAKALVIEEFERTYITELLRKTRGNVSLAARLSGKERSRIGKLIKKYKIERVAFARDTNVM
jgi:DNA-binding NtrC family response regulator